jgi:hypothetical protein
MMNACQLEYGIETRPVDCGVIPGDNSTLHWKGLVRWDHSSTVTINVNACVVGFSGTGKTNTWYRPEGIMRLEAAFVGEPAVRAVAPPFRVEAGRTYNIEYSFGGAKFSIVEAK